jgi:hypothetical protein
MRVLEMRKGGALRPWRVWVGVFLVGLMVFSTMPCQAARAKKTKVNKPPKARQITATQKKIPPFVAFKDDLEKFIGVPYRIGGSATSGMDCSGFAKRFFAEAFGIDLPHNSSAISRLDFLQDLPSDPNEFRPSDLLFFGSSRGRINHVGISLGDDKFIHASRSKGVIVSSLRNSYWKRRLLASKRVAVLDETQLRTLAAAGPADGLSGETSDGNAIGEVMALGYRQALLDDRLSFGLEGLYGDQAFKSAIDVAGDGSGAAWAGAESDSYHGWRALLDVRPANWLCITPWMGRLDVSDGFSGADGALGHYGLKTSIGYSTSPWSLSLAAQTTHFHEFQAPSAGPINDWRSLDLAFDFGYRLDQRSSLSLSGWRSGLYAGSEPELPGSLSDVALHLNIAF